MWSIKKLLALGQNLKLVPRTYALYSLMAIWFCLPLLQSGDTGGWIDWDVHFVFTAAVFRNLYEYGAMPFWNPWYCGGNGLWANPQVPLLSPAYLLAPLFGFPMAMKLNITLHYLLALIGVDLLVSRYFHVKSWASRFFLTTTFTFSGAYALHIAAGHTNFLPVMYTPLVMLFFLRAFESPGLRNIILSAISASLMIANGGFHIFVMTGLGLGIFSLVHFLLNRRIRALFVLAVFGVVSVSLASPKLIPSVLFFLDPRVVDNRNPTITMENIPIDMLWRIFSESHRDWSQQLPESMKEAWWEYGNYLGLGSALFLSAGMLFVIFLSLKRSPRKLAQPLAFLLTAVFFLLMTKGNFGEWSPYFLMHKLPVFSSLRVPSRNIMIFTLFAMMLSAWVLARVDRLFLRARFGRAAWSGMLIAVSLVPWWTNRHNFDQVFRFPLLGEPVRFLGKPSWPHEAFKTSSDAPMYTAMINNEFVLNCYEPLRVKQSYRTGGPIVYPIPAAPKFLVDYRPDQITARLHATQPTRVYLNQNVCDGWTSNHGPLLKDPDNGMYFVSVPAGTEDEVKFTYQPKGFFLGLCLFFVGIFGCFWAMLVEKPVQKSIKLRKRTGELPHREHAKEL